MSTLTIEQMVRAIQRELGAVVDGRPGPETWGKIYQRIVREGAISPIVTVPAVDARSERNIATLLDPVKPLARALIQQCAARGIKIVVTGGTRTIDQQNALYRIGRRGIAGEAKVTDVRGGYSNHNYGVAFDVTLFNGTKPVFESPVYKAIGAIGQGLGLEWGGAWKSPVDEPHFQLRPKWAAKMSESAMIAEFRNGRAFA